MLYRNERIWRGTYKQDDLGPLDVGKTYWYECRNGLFEFRDGHQEAYINLTCINDPYATPYISAEPSWDPPFDHEYNAFPNCEASKQSKYWNNTMTLYRMYQ